MTHSFSPADPSPGQTGTAWPRVPTLHYPTPGTPCPPFPSPSFPGPSCSLSLSPRAADGQQPEVPLWGLPKGPEQMGSATGSPPANEGSQERAVGILSLMVFSQHQGRALGQVLTLRPGAPGSPFSPAFPGSPWRRKRRAVRWRAGVGVEGRAGCGAWGMGPDGQQRLEPRIKHLL